jgi:class 3 adenylate cyclase
VTNGAHPSGTVTFLFTDIEGSTRLWEADPAAMRQALAAHDAMLHAAIDAHSGYVFSTGGDGFAVAFSRAGDAMGAAVDAQRALQAWPWPAGTPLRVRMGVATGEAQERRGDYLAGRPA